MNWFWPRTLNPDHTLWVRIVRMLHWTVAGLALALSIVTFAGMIAGGTTEPISYIAVSLFWLAVALLARGFRYVAIRE